MPPRYAILFDLSRLDPPRLEELRIHARRARLTVKTEFKETSESRPTSFRHLIRELKRAPATVIVPCLSRFATSPRNLIRRVQTIVATGSSIRFLDERLTITPGSAAITFLAALQKMEFALRAVKIRRGLMLRRQLGFALGRHRRAITPEIEAAVTQAVQRGLSARALYREFQGRVSRSRVQAILRRHRKEPV